MTKPSTETPGRKAGRPRIPYDADVASEICDRIAQGQGMREICQDASIPSRFVVYNWMAAEPTFYAAYARAREHQCDAWADDMREIADNASNDYMERIAKNGEIEHVPNPETVQRSKLRIDTLKWLMSKYSPRRFGDKIDVNVSGSVEVSALSDAELEARTKARLKALGVDVAAPLLVRPGPDTAVH